MIGVILGVIVLIMFLFLWSACILSSRCSNEEEEQAIYEKIKKSMD